MKPLLLFAPAAILGAIVFAATRKASADELSEDTTPEDIDQAEAEAADEEANEEAAEAEEAAERSRGTRGKTTSKPPTAEEVQLLVAQALAAGNTDKMLALAKKLDELGFHDAARGLRDEVERIKKGAKKPEPLRREKPVVVKKKKPRKKKPTATKPVPEPTVIEIPEMVIVADKPALNERQRAEDPTRLAAAALTSYLTSIGGLGARFKEDRNKVKQYQTVAGLTTDGLYGRGTAGSIIDTGIIPVAPFYWPRTNTTAAKNEFLAKLDKAAAQDPSRAAEWKKLRADTLRS